MPRKPRDYYTIFPQSERIMVDAITDAIKAAESERNIALVEWVISHYYMQGVRHFSIWDWMEGDVHISYESTEDELEFRFEKILQLFRNELGRLLKMDVSPVCQMEGYGLDSVRHAGIGQAVLSYMISGLNVHKLKSRFFQLLLKYGTAGLLHYRCDGRDIRERTCVDVVPPWELLCFPAEVQHLDDVRGVFRKRMVPLDWLRGMDHLKVPGDEAKMHVEEYAYGSTPNRLSYLSPDEEYNNPTFDHSYEEGHASQKGKEGEEKPVQKWVNLEEFWGYGDRNLVSQYVIKAGDAILLDERYAAEGVDTVCPLSMGRYTPTGRFYGRSFVGPEIGLNDQVEKMLGRQFQIVADADEYGFVAIPTTAGLNMQQVKKRERRKILFFEPDPVVPQAQPFNLQPHSSGDFPGKLVNLGTQLMDMQSGQGELYSGGSPGRVDSASGLGFLYETGNIGLVPTSSEIADVFKGVYEHMLQVAKDEVSQMAMGSRRQMPMKLPLIDDRMVGVVLDPSTGEMRLDNNPIPEPWETKVDIMDRLPINKMQMIQEAKEQVGAQLMSPLEFRILNYREGLGLPIVNRSEWEAYRKAVYQKIILFNDGQTPSQEVIITLEADHPEVTLMVLSHMMNSIEYLHASKDVRQAFENWKIQIEMTLGARMPIQLPYAEDMSVIAAQQMQPQPGGGPPGGGGPQGAPQGPPQGMPAPQPQA